MAVIRNHLFYVGLHNKLYIMKIQCSQNYAYHCKKNYHFYAVFSKIFGKFEKVPIFRKFFKILRENFQFWSKF